LQHLRRTAAELASRDDGGFVYKPGMIGLLRPNTPRNTTQFLLKQKMTLSPKFDAKEEQKEKDRECMTVVDDKYDMTQYGQQVGSRTPEPKLSPLHLCSDYDNDNYSDQDFLFENDCISGTMEGLANYSMFETDPALMEALKNASNEQKSPQAGQTAINAIPEVSNDDEME